jgi:hypothetical protein
MTAARRTLLLWTISAGLFIAAGLRDMFLPGFLSVSSAHGSGMTKLAAGIAILALALVGRTRERKALPR